MNKPIQMIEVGQQIASREWTTIADESVRVPDPARLVHIQFRRYAGCPICSVHLHSMVTRADEIEAAGIREVVFFHSAKKEMLAYQHELPFAVVADPDRRVYSEFGVMPSVGTLLHPKVVLSAMRGVLGGKWHLPKLGENLTIQPADFLIASDGRVVACKYGSHAGDQWSVDELLQLARDHAPAGA